MIIIVYYTAALEPFYCFFNIKIGDHFYTTNFNEGSNATGYVCEGPECRIFNIRLGGTVELHRYFNGAASDHFYIIEPRDVASLSGYKYEGVAGYCHPNYTPGTVPLHRYHNSAISDHFYMTDETEINAPPGGVGAHGYRSQGVACYVIAF